MKDLNYYLNLPYEIKIKPLEDGEFIAQYDNKELNKKCLMCGTGKSIDEAVKDLKEAFKCYVEDALACKEFIPEPKNKEKSKALAITLKESLIDEIDFYAEKLGLSRSSFLSLSAQKYIKQMQI